ncbi:hypothetical protein [Halolamina salifodinae]|uniref:Ribosomal protein S27AE n=1 Tax=Halolamina salifodinae TaxID=1202767 RepID=A0A8T4GU88_9EURY|nr:hypothetical protein [Halolamina salifodinae]MBP1985960.1 ribosomal protein S27AE [Halolamina salifodinae]
MSPEDTHRESSTDDNQTTTSPIKVRWSGDARSKLRTRKLQARLADGAEGAEAAARAMDRQKTQVVAETEAEAVALEEIVSLMAESQYRWTTEGHLKAFRRVRDELHEEMEARDWGEYGVDEESVETTDDLLPEWTAEAGNCSECGSDDTVVEHEDGRRVCAACDAKLQDAGGGVDLPTCETCGETFLSETIAGPGEARRSCGCAFVPEFEVPDDTAVGITNAAIRALNAAGDVETAAQIHEGTRKRLVADGGEDIIDETKALLEVAPDASDAVVNAAFQQKMKSGHPDQGGDTAQFERVKEARDAMLGGESA